MTKRARPTTKRPKPATPAVIAPPARQPLQIVWVALLLAAAACALYASSWHYGLVGDDAFVIARNEFTKQGLSALPRVISHSTYFGAVPLNGGLYRPVAGAYYVVVGALVGLRPAGYHIAQILLYGLNAAIVFLFLARLTRESIALPVVATLLFVAHPIHTEVVSNIKSADEMLCLAFLLTSASAWLAYADTAKGWWRVVSVAAYALAVCSKETAVPMVIVLPALWYFFRRRSVRESLVAAVPFLVVALLYLGVRQLVLASEPPTNIVTALNNALLTTDDRSVQVASALVYFGRYVQMLFWPNPLSFDYNYNAIPLHTFGDVTTWISVALAAGLIATIVLGFKARRIEAFAALWFVASIIIVSNLLFLISTNFGERLLYAASVFACYVAARLLFRLARIGDDQTIPSVLRSPVVAGPLLIVLAVASLASIRRTREWRQEITLFAADVRKYPNSSRLNAYLGNLLYEEAERLLQQPAYLDLATTDLTGAKEHLLRSLAITNEFQDVHAVLGIAEYRLKQYPEAIPHLERALAFKEFRTSALPMMADSYQQLGEHARALELYKQADAEGIPCPLGWFELGNDAAARGDDDASSRYFARFIEANPDNVAGHFNLASARYRKGDFAQALASAEQCVALKPTPNIHASCLLLAADVLERAGRHAEASEHFERAKAIDPNHPWLKKRDSPDR